MTERIKIIYPVKDLAKARTLYSELLGVEPSMDEPYYGGFNVEGRMSVWIPMATARG